jgi:hypothetical protein
MSPNISFQNGIIDEERAWSIIKLLEDNLEYGEPEPWNINYVTNYQVFSKEPDTTNCVTFSFAFAVMYGYPASVVMGTNHCFIVINGRIIEPQQLYNPTTSLFDFRIKDADYDYFKIVAEISKRDKDAIRDFFYK